MNANQLDDIDDFMSLHPLQVKEMVKQYQRVAGATPMGIKAQNNLQGLIWYARDRARRSLTIDVGDLNEDLLNESREDYVMYLKDNEDGQKITELEKFNEKVDFADWDEGVFETLVVNLGLMKLQ